MQAQNAFDVLKIGSWCNSEIVIPEEPVIV